MSLEKTFSAMFGTSEKRGDAFSTEMLPDFIGNFLRSDAGKKINNSGSNYKASLKLSAVYNAVDQISNSNAIIPYAVYQDQDKGREKLKTHPVSILLASEPDGPDGYLTSFVFKKIATVSVLLRGNALFQIHIENSGQQYLEYIPWDDVVDIVKVKNNEYPRGILMYVLKGRKKLLASEVLHYKGFSHDGVVGISVITYACQQMNLAIEVQNFSYTSFENKGVRTGVIETDKVLGNEKVSASAVKTKIKEGWSSAMQTKSPDRIVVLDDGFKFKPINITPQELQILEMARFGVEDVARWFNIALHKIKSMSASTNNNIEQQTIDYSSDTILPIVVSFEQETSKKLLTRKEKNTLHYIKGNMNVLQRSDLNSRANYYAKAINFGWETRNEVRAKEEMNEIEGLSDPLTPANTFTMEQIEANLKKLEGNE